MTSGHLLSASSTFHQPKLYELVDDDPNLSTSSRSNRSGPIPEAICRKHEDVQGEMAVGPSLRVASCPTRNPPSPSRSCCTRRSRRDGVDPCPFLVLEEADHRAGLPLWSCVVVVVATAVTGCGHTEVHTHTEVGTPAPPAPLCCLQCLCAEGANGAGHAATCVLPSRSRWAVCLICMVAGSPPSRAYTPHEAPPHHDRPIHTAAVVAQTLPTRSTVRCRRCAASRGGAESIMAAKGGQKGVAAYTTKRDSSCFS